MSIKWLCIGSGAILLLAMLNWPYGYYVLLRWAISISAVIVAYSFYSSKFPAWALIFTGVAFVFNPILPLYLNRPIWTLLDFIGASLFFYAAYLKNEEKE